jgi:hypothetical protein
VPLVVADTGPINYLVLIGHIDILPFSFKESLFQYRQETMNLLLNEVIRNQ